MELSWMLVQMLEHLLNLFIKIDGELGTIHSGN